MSWPVEVAEDYAVEDLQQTGEFLTALQSRHRDLLAIRDFAEHLRTIRRPDHQPSPSSVPVRR